MVNEAIFSGLVSALSRGESLQNAMFTFYNAGYSKKDIEEAARELHKQTGGQSEKMINPKTVMQESETPSGQILKPIQKPAQKQEQKPTAESLPEAPKQYIQQLNKQEQQPVKKEINKQPEIREKHKGMKPVQIISQYGGQDKAAEKLTKEIETAIHSLKEIKIPSKIQILKEQQQQRSPVIIQKISDYGGPPPKPINRAVTLLLVFILILLMGALAAAFFFKEQLIDLFNKANLF